MRFFVLGFRSDIRIELQAPVVNTSSGDIGAHCLCDQAMLPPIQL